MDRVSRKVTSIALAAVLCFWMAFPVSAFVKPERAEANPAIAIPIIFGTALAAGGVYVAGASMTQYNANLQSVYDGFQQATSQWSQSWGEYVSVQGSFEQAMNSCVTADGTIQLQTLADAGFFDSLNTYSAYCVQNGSMVEGVNSAIGRYSVADLGGYTVATCAGMPAMFDIMTFETSGSYTVFGGYNEESGSNYVNSKLCEPWGYAYFVDGETQSLRFNNNGEVVIPCMRVTWGIYENNAGAKTGRTTSASGYTLKVNGVNDPILNSQVDWSVGAEGANYYTDVNKKVKAGASPAVIDGTATAPTSTVQPFEPTAEQISAGFDSSAVINAINSGTAETSAGINDVISTLTGTIGGVLNDIKTGVNGLESAIGTAISTGASIVVSGVSSAITTGVNTLSTVLNDIKTASQTIEQTLGGAISTTLTGIATGIAGIGTTLGDIWGDLQGWYTDWLAWVGTTPLGALIAQVIAALNAGVLDLSGLLELVNAGVLDLSTAIELVQTAVQDGVAEITGAIEGIQFPSFEWPKVEGSPQVALPPGDMRSSMDAVIQDKAPFAYMYTFGEGIQSLEYSSEPKFRMRHTFDVVADEVEIDINAEPWLNRDLGGVTIAQLLRASVTLTLCMGLLYGAYKTALAAVKAG